MVRSFNFFQFVTGISVGDAIAVVNPNYLDFLTGSGLYTPPEMINTPVRFIWRPFEEYNTPEGIGGRFVPLYSLSFRGQTESSHTHVFTNFPSFSGHFSPLNSGSANFYPVISGAITGDIIDNNLFDIPFSGAITGDVIDKNLFIACFSGSQINKLDDIFIFLIPFSGSQSGIPLDNPIYNVILSGNIVKYVRDNSSIDTSLVSVSWSKGNPSRSQYISGEYLVGVEIHGISWSDQG